MLLHSFTTQRDQLLGLLERLPDQGWSRTATVLRRRPVVKR
jgi:hypothetical protein